MRIIVIGASGTIGSAVVAALAPRHEVVKVGHRSGDFHVDVASPESITALFRTIGGFDALVCTAGEAKFPSLDELVIADYQIGLSSNL